MKNLTNKQLSYAFAGMQITAENKAEPTPLQLLEKVPQYQPVWEKYLNTQSQLMHQGIEAFKNYDLHGKLKSLWVKIENGLPYPKNKTLDLLLPFAMNAYQNEDYEKAFAMFNFLTALYPKNYRLYIFFGELLEKVHGAKDAEDFYKAITNVFNEPELFFAAGEFSMRNEQYDEAKNYLIKAYELYQERPRTDDGTDLRDGIEELLMDMAKICA